MKRNYILILLFMLCSVFAQAQHSYFDKYAEQEGVTSVYISKAMLSMIPNMQTDDLNIGQLTSKLESVQILSCEKPEIIEQLKKETDFISTKNGYEELMRINDEGDKTTIYMKQKKDGLKEFVLLNRSKDEFTLILIVGNLTLQEIQQIVNKG
ncbi:MAG: DUF4252 domain-containing protein [Bacteroidaceae bacterium]|nr:DUF4252 domain-containing protein [Bacteroidaceae bacterium]